MNDDADGARLTIRWSGVCTDLRDFGGDQVPVGEGEATFLTPGSPITFSSTEVGIRHSVPRSGQHTAEVLGDSLPWER